MEKFSYGIFDEKYHDFCFRKSLEGIISHEFLFLKALKTLFDKNPFGKKILNQFFDKLI